MSIAIAAARLMIHKAAAGANPFPDATEAAQAMFDGFVDVAIVLGGRFPVHAAE